MNREVQARLDRITRLWLAPKQRTEEVDTEPRAVKEWRLALKGFGRPADLAGGPRIFGTARRWRSVTPFPGVRSPEGAGYAGEVPGPLKRRGLPGTDIQVEALKEIVGGGTPRRAIHFHCFRSRGRECQPDAAGALLHITLPEPLTGPLAIGYGSHLRLGLFVGGARPSHSGRLSPPTSSAPAIVEVPGPAGSVLSAARPDARKP